MLQRQAKNAAKTVTWGASGAIDFSPNGQPLVINANAPQSVSISVSEPTIWLVQVFVSIDAGGTLNWFQEFNIGVTVTLNTTVGVGNGTNTLQKAFTFPASATSGPTGTFIDQGLIPATSLQIGFSGTRTNTTLLNPATTHTVTVGVFVAPESGGGPEADYLAQIAEELAQIRAGH